MSDGSWYIHSFDTVGEVTGFVIKHSNGTDWLFFPCKSGMDDPPLLNEIVEKLNAPRAEDLVDVADCYCLRCDSTAIGVSE